MSLFLAGQHGEGISTLEEAVSKYSDSPDAYASLGWAYGQAGRTSQAQEMRRRLLAMSDTRYVSPLVLALVLAQVAAGLNDRAGAFAQLERTFRLREPLLPQIGNDPLLEPIRDDRRFRDLLKRLKLDVYFPEKPGEMKRPDDKLPTGGNT